MEILNGYKVERDIIMSGTWTAFGTVTLPAIVFNQGALDTAIVSLRSSDVVTALTSGTNIVDVTTADYGVFSKFAAATGGLLVQALGENAPVTTNLLFESYGGQADTTKSSAGRALIEVYAAQHNGANALAAVAANGNIFAIRGHIVGTVAIVDEDGDLWLNGGLTLSNTTTGALQIEDTDGTARSVLWKDTTNILFFDSSQATMAINYAVAQDVQLWGSSAGTGQTFILYGTAADAGNTLRDAPTLRLTSYYWSGAANTAWRFDIFHDMVTAAATPASHVDFRINSVDILTLTNTNGTITSTLAGDTQFNTKVSIGITGTTTGIIELDGATSGTVTMTVAAVAGTWTMTLPAAVGGAGEQLTDAAGNGITSWAAAASRRELKDIIGEASPQEALDAILNTKVYKFHYKEGCGTQDTETEYVGIMGDEAPWAMHYKGGIVNPVNSLGYSTLAIQALEARVRELEAQLV